MAAAAAKLFYIVDRYFPTFFFSSFLFNCAVLWTTLDLFVFIRTALSVLYCRCEYIFTIVFVLLSKQASKQQLFVLFFSLSDPIQQHYTFQHQHRAHTCMSTRYFLDILNSRWAQFEHSSRRLFPSFLLLLLCCCDSNRRRLRVDCERESEPELNERITVHIQTEMKTWNKVWILSFILFVFLFHFECRCYATALMVMLCWLRIIIIVFVQVCICNSWLSSSIASASAYWLRQLRWEWKKSKKIQLQLTPRKKYRKKLMSCAFHEKS
jgi:hypothetical protein